MTVLGIETATTVCGVAVVRDGTVIAEAASDERNSHAERIMGFVERTVGLAGGLGAVEGIAVSIGPGSFTGLRIGLSVAKGLAFASGLPVAAVPTLEALALRALLEGRVSAGDRLLALLSARRGEAYAGWFLIGQEAVEAEGEVRVVPLTQLAEEAARPGVIVTGEIELLHPPEGGSFRTVGASTSRCSATAVALLGARMLKEGRASDPSTLEPGYVLDFFLSVKPGRS